MGSGDWIVEHRMVFMILAILASMMSTLTPIYTLRQYHMDLRFYDFHPFTHVLALSSSFAWTLACNLDSNCGSTFFLYNYWGMMAELSLVIIFLLQCKRSEEKAKTTIWVFCTSIIMGSLFIVFMIMKHGFDRTFTKTSLLRYIAACTSLCSYAAPIFAFLVPHRRWFSAITLNRRTFASTYWQKMQIAWSLTNLGLWLLFSLHNNNAMELRAQAFGGIAIMSSHIVLMVFGKVFKCMMQMQSIEEEIMELRDIATLKSRTRFYYMRGALYWQNNPIVHDQDAEGHPIQSQQQRDQHHDMDIAPHGHHSHLADEHLGGLDHEVADPHGQQSMLHEIQEERNVDVTAIQAHTSNLEAMEELARNVAQEIVDDIVASVLADIHNES